MKIKVYGFSTDGFIINEEVDTRKEALYLCKEAGLNPLTCIYEENFKRVEK